MPELPDLDRAQLAAFNRCNKLEMRLLRLGEHTAPDGRLVLVGRLGARRVLIRQGQVDVAGGTTWDMTLVEP
jgi:hypothetical protein